jgi:hypothetical protein
MALDDVTDSSFQIWHRCRVGRLGRDLTFDTTRRGTRWNALVVNEAHLRRDGTVNQSALSVVRRSFVVLTAVAALAAQASVSPALAIGRAALSRMDSGLSGTVSSGSDDSGIELDPPPGSGDSGGSGTGQLG